MTCTNKQIGKFMKLKNTYTQETAALKVGIDRKTARKYIKAKYLPSELKKPHEWRTRQDAFQEIWPTLEAMLEGQPRLEAKTLLEWLIVENIMKKPPPFHQGQLRTLQRRVRDWRALHGPDQEVIFPQDIKPGKQSQSDYTWMNSLEITLAGQFFPHLLFHFMLPYSRWEYVSICFSESFDSLTLGYTEAVWYLGGIARDHRTDNLSAATHSLGEKREFNESWEQFLEYHGAKASRNNPGESHENGSVEKSHHLFKKTVDQQLMLRGSRDFDSQKSYEAFLLKIQVGRNLGRQKRLQEELPLLKSLPERKWYAPHSLMVSVTPASTILVNKGVYSVPSRLIGHILVADVLPKTIEVRYGRRLIQTMPRLPSDTGALINYRHIVSYLIRKPGAFPDYQYRDCLFPQLIFRTAYDVLIAESPSRGGKHYLQVLHLASIGCENDVAAALEILCEQKLNPLLASVKELLDMAASEPPLVSIDLPQIADYDCLLSNMTGRA